MLEVVVLDVGILEGDALVEIVVLEVRETDEVVVLDVGILEDDALVEIVVLEV